MNKRKIAAIMAAAVILNFSAPSIQVLADEISSNLTLTEGVQSTKANVSKFELLNSSNITAYDEAFKMDNSNIESITPNGGNYNSASAANNAIDGDFNTHWETGKQNTSEFTNEVVFKFKELIDLNRIVYAARQSSAKGKGFAKEIEIYGSITDEEDDFRLISSGEYTGSTGDVVEIKFNKTTFKRIKFVFKEADQNWASASEFMFYKEDKLSDKMKTLFTDDTMSKVNEEFNTIEKISALEEEAKKHPLYSIFKEDIENAKILLEQNKIEPSTVKVSRLEAYHNGKDAEYSEIYRMPNSNIVNVSANGGVYPTTKLEYMLDDNPDTHWETRTNNTEDFTNEVIFTLDKPEVLNRIAFLARDNRKGFPEKFEIYASETTKGDTFQLVATGSAQSTNDFLEFKFQPTKFKRIKFKFVKAYIDRPFVAEFRFYKEDRVSDKMANLFTDATMSKVSEEFNTVEKLEALENEVKDHPLYEEFKEDIENAKILLQENKIEATTAITTRFEDYSNNEYSNLFKMNNSNIKGIKNNGRHYASQVIANAIDDNLDTYWETNTYNTNDFTNEVEIEFKETVELNRIVYGARKSDNKGFAKEFEIYASTTSAGETYQLVATGKHDKVSGLVEAKFNPTKFRRVKFKFKDSDQNWATLSEIAFYKQDKVADKVERLFTNELKNELSAEFNTKEKLQALEEETKTHPLYDRFKENLENANELLNQQKIEPTKAITKKFDHYSNEEYSSLFKMDNSNIKGIKNNGRHYASQVITNAIDDNLDTYWETNTYNTNDFTNEVEVEFKEAVELNRIVYGARKSDNKGFAKEFEIYASTTSVGETYQLVAVGKHDKVSGLVEAKFNPTKFKRVKFKFKNSDQNWATLSEITFYKQDIVSDKVESLFTNGLMNELSEEFNTIEKLQALENEAKGHPLEDSFKESFEIANKILKGKLETVKVITAEQHGDMVAHAKNNLKFGFGNNNQPTGISAKPGDEITVYVDADPSEPMPKLAFSQQEGSFANWMRTVNLNVGKNVITVPEIAVDSWYNHDVTRGGSIYIVNPYTPEEQSKAPVIRFESGDKYPFLTEDTNVNEFKEFLIEYKKAIDEDIAKNPDVLDREVLDVFEFVSDHLVWTGTATGAYKAYIEQGANPLDTVNRYNNHMKELFKYYGLDGRNEQNDPKYIRENVRLAQPYGYMYAYTNHIGVQRDVMTGLLVGEPGWGLDHEIGHRMDVNARLYGEVTNNMLPMYMSVYYNKVDNRIPYENEVYKNVISENSNKYSEGGLAENLAVYWQLEMYKPGYWGELNSLYRERNVNLGNENPDNVKMQYLVKFSSEVVGEDLSEYFARHGFEVNEETREETSKYQKPDKKIWYLNNSKANYKGNGFTQDTNLDVSLAQVENGVKLTFNIDDNVKSDLLGYEILKDGELIGFTSSNSFVDINADKTKNSKYEVIPYDLNLGTGDVIEIYSFTPSMSIKNDKITLGLGEEFNPMDYIKVLDHEGNDIISNVEVTNNVDTSKKGVYQVKYKINDEGIEVEKFVEVEVVSLYDYASDLREVSSKVGSGSLTKDKSIRGGIITFLRNGSEFTYSKGIGAHANSEVVYNIENKGYEYFESYIGVDQWAKNTAASVTFEVWVDGEKKFDSKVFKHDTDSGYVRVNVSGAKEVKLITTDAKISGNSYDHSIWADAKFITNNSKPVINTEDKIYKLDEEVDFKAGITATDVEDGDLTSNIEIISNSYEKDKFGRFEVIYKVTDSDNNTTEKKSYITVYEDYKVVKSKYGQFDNLDKYNEEFKIPVSSVTNNGGKYFSSVIENAIDNNINSHWETNKPNSDTFQNEVVFDLGESKEINRIAYAARRDAGGKGFARKFEIYVSNDAEGNDFVLAGKGEYSGSNTDIVEFKISKTTARRVKFKFIEAYNGMASLGEISFYKADELADKIDNLFTDNTKTEVTESYNTLDKVQALREEVKNHPAANLFEEGLVKAEEIIRAKFPTIDVENITYIKLNSEFDLTSDVTANDQEDGNITNKVTIDKGDFNVSRPGKYTLTYSITDNDGNVTTKDREVVVYSESNYLSDLDWESAVSGWKNVNKDSAVNLSEKIKLKVNGQIKEFDKGIGAATNAEIVYKLDGNYTNFSTYLGTDKNYDDNRTTIIFKIFADGEEVYSSDVIRKDSEAEFVNLDVTGVKELKLVADDADKNGLGDFASWADTKVYTTNAKPKLTIPKSLSTKLGEEIDLNEEYSAIDAEDGDITDKVQVSGKVNFNKTGKYPITYKVTDTDGNEVVKTRTIAVIDMNDYSYLTDYDWKAAQYNYTVPKKDISISGNALRLTDENGKEVSFERGVGAHSTSTITYDLTDKDYGYFSSYVGVDRQMHNTVGSVSFEVYVDGAKKFDSGLMTSKEPMKYLEVDINGAKELKLVVTDGGNGNGSDHATWGDAKLHFANDVQGNYEELESLVNEVKDYEQDIYSEESFKVLQEALKKAEEMLADKISTQDEINLMVDELKLAISNLEEKIDLNEIITIKDKSLKDSIKKELNLLSDNITIGDMYKLTKLSVSNAWISSLEGLQYAKNLEQLDISYNEIKDLSPLKNLKKLTDLNGNPQIITEGMLYAKDNTVTLDYKVLNRNGERLKPREIIIRSNENFEVVNLTLEELIDENGVISFDVSTFDRAVYSMYLVYEDKEDNFLSQSLYMFDVE